jgi:hypothetical protein
VSEAIELTRTAELLLIRLLPISGKTLTNPKRVRDELRKFGARLESDEAWDRLVASLAQAGLVLNRPLAITDAGRERAMEILGLAQLPPRLTWPQIRDKHLVPLAAGGGPAKEHSSKDKLAGLLLKRKYDLPLQRGATLANAAVALVCRELGFPELTDLKALEAAVISRLLQSPEALPLKNAIEQLVRIKLGAPRGKVDELRQALVAQWIAEKDEAKEKSEIASSQASAGASAGGTSASRESAEGANDLPGFVQKVTHSARHSFTGWFGDNKLFISHAWRAFRSAGDGAARLDLQSFKQRLVEANTRGLLRLGRADLVAAMNEQDVRDSEIKYLNAEFHFLLIEGQEA